MELCVCVCVCVYISHAVSRHQRKKLVILLYYCEPQSLRTESLTDPRAGMLARKSLHPSFGLKVFRVKPSLLHGFWDMNSDL